MKDFAESFYKSTTWQKCRASYIKTVGGLCERCYAAGIIRHGDTVHHKVHLTAENITDPAVTLNYENLMLLCRDCHAEVHKSRKRYEVDENGKLRCREI